ncbi:MAG: molybdopterin-dependent oxidoreductase [Dehalococcoidales bacterium]|nr:molybdopterin-dependent oxidoreductase [Dehalococcoidales bacterium]
MSEANELKPAEIRQYNGVNLSSVNDFRENSIRGPQRIDITSYRLKVAGLVSNPQNYTFQETLDTFKHYKKVITLDCVEGWGATILWEGVLVKDILAAASPLPEARVVIFQAHDGYTTSLPRVYVVKKDILIAYKMNGIDLPVARGFPFHLVAESKWGYKWIRWLTSIELSADEKYRGYWEQLGYSNTADADKGFFED